MLLACQKKNTLFTEENKTETETGAIHKIILTDINDTNEMKIFILNDKVDGKKNYYYFYPKGSKTTYIGDTKSDKDMATIICSQYSKHPFEAYSISEDGKNIVSCKCEDVMSKIRGTSF